MKMLMEKIKKNRFLFVVFGINFVIAFISMGYFVLKNGGIFTLVDDFNAQEIPFNMLCNEAIKSGDVFWNWNIDIGSDFVTTFSFYNLGSPFFWITLLFPAEVFPYIMGWVYMLKYAVAGLFSYIYIKSFVSDKYAALIGSMLYAFSGFQSCNLVFYHFHDVVAMFPLLLIGLEKLQIEKKKGVFAFAVFVNVLLNYFFFIGEVIFVVIYYIVRFMRPDFKDFKNKITEHLRRIGRCIVEGAIGVAMAAVLFVPSILSILQNTRVSEHLTASEALTYDTGNFLSILKGMFFPADIMRDQSAIYEMNWYSVSAYLPLVGMFLVLVYVYNKKKEWISALLKVCIVMSLIPILNNLFVMFQREYYRRWYYMPVLIMALASAFVIEKRNEYRLKKPFLITVGIMAGYVAYMVLYPWEWANGQESGILRPLVFAFICAVGIVGVILTYALVKYAKKYYMRLMIAATAFFCFVTTGLNTFLYRRDTGYENSKAVYNDIIVTGQELDEDIMPYRYMIYDWYNNRSMAGYVPSRNSFISTISPSIFEFYDSLGTPRHVAGPSGPEGTNEILSVGYYVMADPWSDPLFHTFNNGYRDIYIYHDEKALPIGFTYDTYMTKSEFEKIDSALRGMAMLKTLIIADKDEESVSKVLRKYNSETDGAYDVALREDIKREHKKEASEAFWYNSTGFGSNITTDSEKFAFYSVPYSNGWSASINGKEAKILNINGLMAVKLENGENVIEFSYMNKGLILGAALSAAGIIVWIGYMIYHRKRKEGVA